MPAFVSWTVPVTDRPGANPWAWKIACPSREFVTLRPPSAWLITARGSARTLVPAAAAQPEMATIAARVINLGSGRREYIPVGWYIGRLRTKTEAF